MGAKKGNPKEVRHIRKVTLVSESDIELVPNMNEVLTKARDIAVTQAKSNILPTYDKDTSDAVNQAQGEALDNSSKLK